MASFATPYTPRTANNSGFNTTFRIQGKIYHLIGSLLPQVESEAKFLQIYFVGSDEDQINVRCSNLQITQAREREIVALLQPFLHEHNELIRLFKQLQSSLQGDNYSIVIRPNSK